jgi:hypothetical protein
MRCLRVGLLCVGLSGCPTSGNTGPAVQTPTGSTGPTGTSGAPVYSLSLVDTCGTKTGTQTVMVKTSAGASFVTISEGTTTTGCTPMDRPQTQVENYDLCYGEVAGANVTTRTVASIPLIAVTGVGLAASAAGEVSVGYTGGPNAAIRCGGSDLLVVSKTGASFSAPRTVAESSQGTVPANQQADCVQNICNQGDATGFWPALIYDNNNVLVSVFRDLHFGFASDDFAKSDVEMVRGNGAVQTIDVSHGGGEYLKVQKTRDGHLTILHYNKEGPANQNGLWANREGASGFERQRLTNKRIGELFGFAVSANDLHGLAFYDADAKRLSYMESTDGDIWTEPEDVDTDGDTGQYASLTFDASGEPAIAYYRCNDYSPNTTTCDPSKDGLYLARRVQGAWKKAKIAGDGPSFDGLYPAIVNVSGKLLIAYQKRSFDPSSGATSSQLYLAREP